MRGARSGGGARRAGGSGVAEGIGLRPGAARYPDAGAGRVSDAREDQAGPSVARVAGHHDFRARRIAERGAMHRNGRGGLSAEAVQPRAAAREDWSEPGTEATGGQGATEDGGTG